MNGPSIARPARRAFSLIEILVVIAVVAILAALLLMAAQAAREASRRSSCSNNLRQVGLALAQYVTATGVYPQGSNGRGYSPHTMILPYLEQGPVYDALNFALDELSLDNLTAASVVLSAFLCPSDPSARGGHVGPNYAGNQGRGAVRFGHDGMFDGRTYGRPFVLTPSGIRDGLSRTACFAEWALTPLDDSRDPKGSVYRVTAAGTAEDFDEFVAECRGLDPGTAEVSSAVKGGWLYGELGESLYNHTLPIGGRSCIHDIIQAGTWSVASHHPGGANVAFADGHVAFGRDSIDGQVWRALGTRDGGEVVSDDSF